MTKAILLDLDGTLTVDRNSYLLDLDALKVLRDLQSLGVKAFIVTGNSYPVSRGLATYLGMDGVVAENGCVVYAGEEHFLCKEVKHVDVKEFESRFELKGSWQNAFRKYDFGFYPPKITPAMQEWALEKGLSLKTSGYALHLSYNSEGKLVGVRKLLDLLKMEEKDIVAIGDSLTDIDMMKLAGVKVAVANGDDELKAFADLVTKGDSGEGVKEYIMSLVNALHGRN